MKIVNVVGARPNFMKIAPIIKACRRSKAVEPLLVHTGQHYDERMSDLFFHQLEIPEPAINLGVGSASHAAQTAGIMKAFEPVVLEHKPDAVLVVGDVNSTVACGLVAVKLGVKLIHVEAGLRSFDRTMPEEINRLLTDSISDLLFCTEQSGVDNLIKEGIPKEKVFLVGNVMIDTLLSNRARAEESGILDQLSLNSGGFAVLTLHRPANVDDPAVLGRILDAIEVILNDMPVVFPIHPRTRESLAYYHLGKRLEELKNLLITDPLGYLDFLKLMTSARLVLTDSGGIQEETTILKVPCLTLRESTERPITSEIGSNQIVGTNPDRIVQAYRQAIHDNRREPQVPPLWDGLAAERIVGVLVAHGQSESRNSTRFAPAGTLLVGGDASASDISELPTMPVCGLGLEDLALMPLCERIPGSGVDLDAYHPSHPFPRNGVRRFLMFGRLVPKKGYDLFLEVAQAFHDTQKDHVEFCIMGMVDQSREESKQLLKRILALQERGVVKYLAPCDDVVPILHAVDVVVLPSEYNEGVPRSLLEAMACGKPVVTTDWKGCRDTVEHGVNGYLIRPGNREELEHYIGKLANISGQRLQQMGQASRRKAQMEFPEKSVLDSYLHEVNSCMRPEHVRRQIRATHSSRKEKIEQLAPK